MRAGRVVTAAVLVLASATLGGAAIPARAGDRPAGFSGKVTATRSFLDADGTSHVVDRRTIDLTVSQTTNLRGRQQVRVTWKGAHPTGGTVADVNSGDAALQEYPFVLLECRGVDAAGAKDRLRPETCWTQTWSERFQKDNTTGYPAWRSDRYARADQRTALVGAPDPRPAGCFRPALAERWVPFDAADGTAYYGGSVGCAGMAPESADVGGAGIPSNATYGLTNPDGAGSTDFDVWTADENASLGCSDTVPCALVAVPIEGVSCDAYGTLLPADQQPPAKRTAAADAPCRAAGQYATGQPADPGTRPDGAVTGALWWSPSNWRNRITVPLSFATPASACSVVSDDEPVAVYGSVLMSEAAAQWEPTFCTDHSLYPFVHVQTADSAARTLIGNGAIAAALGSRPPDGGFGRPVVQAPVAVTGFAITYAIDDAQGNAYHSLRLDARLLAKLLTESYPANSLVRDNYPALAGNPMNITQDPEFVAFNPGLPRYGVLESAATLMALSSDADLTWALTAYIDADPEARAWLNGQPDPWGMVVNPTYLRVSLPVGSWPLLDDFTLPDAYVQSQNNPCYSYSPAPYLQLIANPASGLATIVQNVQFGLSNALISCPNGDPSKVSTLRMSVQGREPVGRRFVLGIASLGAAHRYDLPAAALQTSLDHPDLAARFTDSSGRQFVAADDAGLRKAVTLLKADEAQRTWTLDPTAVGHAAGAYPGTLPVYADVPTSGLAAATAAHLATLLRYAAGPGQVAGTSNGELPPGYLPLTKADGLGELAAYTKRAADAVAAQRGDVPGLAAPAPGRPSPPPTAASTSTGQPPDAGGVPAPPPLPGPVASSATASPAPGSGSSTPSTGPSGSPVRPQLRAVGYHSRLAAVTFPLLAVLALLCGLAGALLRYPALVTSVVRRRPRGRRS